MMLSKLDDEIKEQIQIHGEIDGRPISCHKCTSPGCCYQTVFVQFAHALLIARHLVKVGRDGPLLRTDLKERGGLMTELNRDAYFNLIKPCFFLNNGLCSIYSLRPVDCRSYYVVTPAEDCLPPANGRSIGSLAMVSVRIRSAAIGKEAHRLLGLKETGMRILMGPLPSTVALALEVLQDDVGDWRDHVRRQRWPTVDTLQEMGSSNAGHVPVLQQLENQSRLLQLSKKK